MNLVLIGLGSAALMAVVALPTQIFSQQGKVSVALIKWHHKTAQSFKLVALLMGRLFFMHLYHYKWYWAWVTCVRHIASAEYELLNWCFL